MTFKLILHTCTVYLKLYICIYINSTYCNNSYPTSLKILLILTVFWYSHFWGPSKRNENKIQQSQENLHRATYTCSFHGWYNQNQLVDLERLKVNVQIIKRPCPLELLWFDMNTQVEVQLFYLLSKNKLTRWGLQTNLSSCMQETQYFLHLIYLYFQPNSILHLHCFQCTRKGGHSASYSSHNRET